MEDILEALDYFVAACSSQAGSSLYIHGGSAEILMMDVVNIGHSSRDVHFPDVSGVKGLEYIIS